MLLNVGLLPAQALAKIRSAYTTAADSEANAVAFETLMAQNVSTDGLLTAYRGASKVILAKYKKNRIALLKEGKPLIEEAIARQPDNVELRLIRLSVQENLPKIVPYRNHIAEDKAFIIANYERLPLDVRHYVAGYIKKSKEFTAADKKALGL